MNATKLGIKKLAVLTIILLGLASTAKAAMTQNFKLMLNGTDYLDPQNHPMMLTQFPNPSDPNWEWFGIFLNQGNWQLDYDYIPQLLVFRDGKWIPLKDVNNTICVGEKIKASVETTAEWRGGNGCFLGTPMAFIKDNFDWSGIDGCNSDSYFTTLATAWDMFSFNNSFYGPTIFKNPTNQLSSTLESCNGTNCASMDCSSGTCTAPDASGKYKLNLLINQTEARQHYWQFGQISPPREGNGCHALTYFDKDCYFDISSYGGHPNVNCGGKEWNDYLGPSPFHSMFPVIESVATIPEWSSNSNGVDSSNYVVTVKNDGTCGKCINNDGVCDANCSPCDTDCDTCCGADAKCNTKCPNDPDCCGADGICNQQCTNDPDCGVIPAGVCIVTRTKPSLDVDTVKPSEEVKYHAEVQGGGSPIGYDWYCDRNGGISANHTSNVRTDDQSCNYGNEGDYTPKAVYSYKDEKGNVRSQECVNAQGVNIKVSQGVQPANSNIKPVTSCSVNVNSSNIRKGDNVTTGIDFVPSDATLDGATVNWKINGEAISTKVNETVTKQLNSAGSSSIEASVVNGDGSTVSCQSATVNVKDTVRWGN